MFSRDIETGVCTGGSLFVLKIAFLFITESFVPCGPDRSAMVHVSWLQPNTNDLYIHYIAKSILFVETKELPNCVNKYINVLKNCISTSVASVLKCMK